MSNSPFFKAEMSGENNCRYYNTAESDRAKQTKNFF